MTPPMQMLSICAVVSLDANGTLSPRFTVLLTRNTNFNGAVVADDPQATLVQIKR